MTTARRLAYGACLGLSLVALAGCATTTKVAHAPPAAPAPISVSPKERVDRAVTLLNAGDPAGARVELVAAIAQPPGDPRARKLLDQIDRDPVSLLGIQYYCYRVRAGETLFQIAGKLLGDPQLVYALARYNGLAAPATLEAGRILKIPGEEPRRASAPRPAKAPAAAAPAPVVRASRDPGRANQLRGAALEHMSGGRIDRAVTLLRQARELDPENTLIRRDLNRATRIQGAVRAAS